MVTVLDNVSPPKINVTRFVGFQIVIVLLTFLSLSNRHVPPGVYPRLFGIVFTHFFTFLYPLIHLFVLPASYDILYLILQAIRLIANSISSDGTHGCILNKLEQECMNVETVDSHYDMYIIYLPLPLKSTLLLVVSLLMTVVSIFILTRFVLRFTKKPIILILVILMYLIIFVKTEGKFYQYKFRQVKDELIGTNSTTESIDI